MTALPSRTIPTGALVDFDVPVPARDGTVLRADVMRPRTDRTVPVILLRTPYGQAASRMQLEWLRAIQEGFAVVSQSVRGTGTSAGTFEPWRHEAADGADAVAWCAAQPWSSGAVGMLGSSYLGQAQLYAAGAASAALRAIAPGVTPSHPYEMLHEGGAFHLGFAVSWASGGALLQLNRRQAQEPRADADETMARLLDVANDPWAAFRTRPLRAIPAIADSLPAWADWLDHPSRDGWWNRLDLPPRPEVPALFTTGWWDVFASGSLAEWERQPRHPGSRLIIGPWSHALDGEVHGEVWYGRSSAAPAQDVAGEALRFLGRHVDVGARRGEDGPPVRYFLMGANAWCDADEWPPRTTPERWYLRSGGGLTREHPEVRDDPVGFDHDPLDPVPTLGGRNLLQASLGALLAGPMDQASLDGRADLARFTSGVLAAEHVVTGTVTVSLEVRTTAADSDWTAKLVDVGPDGRGFNVVDGIVRARYRNGTDRARLAPAGEPFRVEISLGPVAHAFLAGHRLRVEVAGSNFPRFDPNPGTGGSAADLPASDYVQARHTLHLDAERASWLSLPVRPR